MTLRDFAAIVNALQEYEEFGEKAADIGIEIFYDDRIIELEYLLVDAVNRELKLDHIYDERGFTRSTYKTYCEECHKELPYDGLMPFKPEYTLFEIYVYQTHFGKDLPIGAEIEQNLWYEKYSSEIFADISTLFKVLME